MDGVQGGQQRQCPHPCGVPVRVAAFWQWLMATVQSAAIIPNNIPCPGNIRKKFRQFPAGTVR